MPLGLGAQIGKGGMPVVSHVTNNLQLKHNYNAGAVVPVSDGAVYMASTEGLSITEKTYDVDGTACSFVFWIKEVSGNNYCAILGHTSESDHKFILLPNSTNNQLVMDGDTDNNLAKSDLNDTDLTKWHHFAITTNGSGGVKMYQNGVQLEASTDATIGVNITFNQIGRRGPGSAGFGGYICNLGTWEGNELTQPEIKSIMWKTYTELSSTEKENMVAWWNLSEDFNDSHGSNNGSAV